MDWPRLRRVWRRIFALAWPVMVEQTSRTLMRTVDILVTVLLSPAAVVAIGLADLYARFPLRIGLGLGGGAIALSSQDTGSDATTNRSEAITQALLIGALAGIPFVFFGFLLGDVAIGLFPASEEAIRLGSLYLAIIFATAPARHVALIGARALQGTGDTRTPMYVNLVVNAFNIVASVVLAFGLFGFPRLEVVGVGLATAVANALSAGLLLAVIYRPGSEISFARPRDHTIGKQLLVISAPRMAEGFVAELAEFPFNALLLGFGDAVNAGFQIGRRVYQQVTGPLARGYNVAASILVGQALGVGDEPTARYNGLAVAGLGILTVGGIGLLLAYYAEPVVRLLGSGEGDELEYAVTFAQVYGLSGPILALFVGLSGSLQGAGETRIPFLARLTGMFGFFVGFSALAIVLVGTGPIGAYLGVFLAYAWMAGFVFVAFSRTDWAGRATDMMRERGSLDPSDD
ncbi:MATE family efflux transporter [Haloferacaceae archaeon DSL9]